MLRQRPVDYEKVEKHRKRAKLPKPEITQQIARAQSAPSIPSQYVPAHLKASESLFHSIEILIARSFETAHWKFYSNDRLIHSSPNEDAEKIELQEFIGDIDCADEAAKSNNFSAAGKFWQSAFDRVPTLVQAQYHDVIPNLLQKINDLQAAGYTEVADKLRSYVAGMARAKTPDNPLVAFQELGLEQFRGIEQVVMSLFSRLFEFYLGAACYSSFVMLMDSARRRLVHNPWEQCDDVLPNLFQIDVVFGPADRRSMDIISLRIEVEYRRLRYGEVKRHAEMMIQRADMILDDDWLMYYYLTRSYYFLGCAQFHLGEKMEAQESFARSLLADYNLCLIKDFSIFNTEKIMMRKYLEELNK